MSRIIAIAALAATCLAGPAWADEALDKQPVRIEADQTAKAFVFIIDNQPVALLDKGGLHVTGDIEYGGALTDMGSDNVREKIRKIITSQQKEATHD